MKYLKCFLSISAIICSGFLGYISRPYIDNFHLMQSVEIRDVDYSQLEESVSGISGKAIVAEGIKDLQLHQKSNVTELSGEYNGSRYVFRFRHSDRNSANGEFFAVPLNENY